MSLESPRAPVVLKVLAVPKGPGALRLPGALALLVLLEALKMPGVPGLLEVPAALKALAVLGARHQRINSVG